MDTSTVFAALALSLSGTYCSGTTFTEVVGDSLHPIRFFSVTISASGDQREHRSYYSDRKHFDDGKAATGGKAHDLWMGDALTVEKMTDSLVIAGVNKVLETQHFLLGDEAFPKDPRTARLWVDLPDWHYDMIKGGAYRFTVTAHWRVQDAVNDRTVWDTVTTGVSRMEQNNLGGYGNTLVDGLSQALAPVLAAQSFRSLLHDNGGPFSPAYASWERLQLPGPTVHPVKVGQAMPCVVSLVRGKDHCSGVVISSVGHIVTTATFSERDTSALEAIFFDGTKAPAHFLRANPAADIALYKVDRAGIPALAADRSGATGLGDVVFAIATPSDVALGQSITTGVLSNFRTHEGERFLQTDVKVSPGSGGGALTSTQGGLIGIIVAKWFGRDVQGIGFALAVDRIEEALKIVLPDQAP